MMTDRSPLRRLMAEKETVITCGCGDAISAKIINEVDGFDGVLSSGFTLAAMAMGLPDAELYSRSDNVYAVSNMCYVLDKPLIADIDTAYGNAVTTIKTVNDFERAGASGVVIEDQISPKRCPICVTDLNTTISAEEAAGKIRAAAENRLYKDTLIIARTDITNVEERNRRAQMYLEAGADLVQGISKSYTASGNMVENIKQFVDAMDGRVSLVVCGGLDSLTRKDIEYIKPKICHFALVPINYMYPALRKAIEFVGENHEQAGIPLEKANHSELVNFLGMSKIGEQEKKYIPQIDC